MNRSRLADSLLSHALFVAILIAVPAAAMANQIVVVPAKGTAAQNGTSLLAAYNGITGSHWGNRFLVQLEPGVYDVGTQSLVMKDWVSLAGSGIDVTLLYGDGNVQFDINRGIIHGANNTEIRELTVRAFPAEGRQVLLPIVMFGVSPRITDVSTQAFGSTEYCGGIFGRATAAIIDGVTVRSSCAGAAFGIVLDGPPPSSGRPSIARADVIAASTITTSFPTGLRIGGAMQPSVIRNSKIVGSGGSRAVGIELAWTKGFEPAPETTLVLDSTIIGRNAATTNVAFYQEELLNPLSFAFEHSTLEATGEAANIGILHDGIANTISVESGRVEGSTNTVTCPNFGMVEIGVSRMDGGPVTCAGTVSCAGVYDESFTFFPNTCP